jgi:asparagine synthase (glutamine-hydrolysing)
MMKGVLPEAILNRKKLGFGVPIDHWFRHELREMAYDVLLDRRAVGRGYFQTDVIRGYLDEHVERRADHQYRLWALLMLELWLRTFIDQRASVAAPSVA